MKIYTGIGSRETPPEICQVMTKLAAKLEQDNYILRSGGADGADAAFEAGVHDNKNKEIFLPWQNFNNNKSPLYNYRKEQLDKCRELLSKVCTAEHLNKMSQGAYKLHMRNCMQVLGINLDTPTNFIVCWTKDGKATGGTATAIKLAELYNIKVYNLYNRDILNRITNYINS